MKAVDLANGPNCTLSGQVAIKLCTETLKQIRVGDLLQLRMRCGTAESYYEQARLPSRHRHEMLIIRDNNIMNNKGKASKGSCSRAGCLGLRTNGIAPRRRRLVSPAVHAHEERGKGSGMGVGAARRGGGPRQD